VCNGTSVCEHLMGVCARGGRPVESGFVSFGSCKCSTALEIPYQRVL